jgi:hypothetical protein
MTRILGEGIEKLQEQYLEFERELRKNLNE